MLKALRHHVRARAQKLQVPPELLVRKREYEALVRSGLESGDYRLPESLRGWRYPVVGEELLALAEQFQNAPLFEPLKSDSHSRKLRDITYLSQSSRNWN